MTQMNAKITGSGLKRFIFHIFAQWQKQVIKKHDIMGIINQGILGGFSGKVGPIVGFRWKSNYYIRARAAKVSNPRTPKQQEPLTLPWLQATGYTYATFKDYITTNSKLEEISYNGNYVPFVPKHTLSLGGQYIFRINPGHWLDRIQLNANYTGAGRIYWTEQNDVSQAFYGTLNGRLSLQKGNGQIDFWVRNALDKDYAAFYFESMGNGFMQKGRPIQAGIELRCRFW